MKLDSILLYFVGRKVLVLWPEPGCLGLADKRDFHLHGIGVPLGIGVSSWWFITVACALARSSMCMPGILNHPQILCLWLYYFHSSVCFYSDPLPTSKFPFPSRFQCFKSNPWKMFALQNLWRFCISCFVYICFNFSGFAFVLTFSSKHMLLHSYISTRKTFVIGRNGFR